MDRIKIFIRYHWLTTKYWIMGAYFTIARAILAGTLFILSKITGVKYEPLEVSYIVEYRPIRYLVGVDSIYGNSIKSLEIQVNSTDSTSEPTIVNITICENDLTLTMSMDGSIIFSEHVNIEGVNMYYLFNEEDLEESYENTLESIVSDAVAVYRGEKDTVNLYRTRFDGYPKKVVATELAPIQINISDIEGRLFDDEIITE